MKLETFTEDYDTLLKFVRENNRSPSALNQSPTTGGPSVWKHIPVYKDVPSDVIRKLYNLYRFDFEAFGFSYDLENHVGSCGGNIESSCC